MINYQKDCKGAKLWIMQKLQFMEEMMKKNKKITLIVIILIVTSFLIISKNFDFNNYIKSLHPQKGDFIKVGKMFMSGSNHQAVLLDDGNVLILTPDGDKSEEYIYKTKKFIQTIYEFKNTGHKNIIKLNNEKILILGGSDGYPQKNTQLYDTTAKNFKNGPSMNYERTDATASLLRNGKVIVIGGDIFYYLDKRSVFSEIYNVKTNTFEFAAKMHIPRYKHSAILLKDGKVLVVGGVNKSGMLSDAEIYNPETNLFTLTGKINIPRKTPKLYMLKNGNVLIIGGFRDRDAKNKLDSICVRDIEIYNPKTNEFKIVNKRQSEPWDPSTVQLRDDKILFTGGCKGIGLSLICYKSSEIYDPYTNTFTKGKDMNYKREDHIMTLLKDDNVLITGTRGKNKTAELYISK